MPGSSFPASEDRQPATAPVPIHILVLFLMAITLLSPEGSEESAPDRYRSDTLALWQGNWVTSSTIAPTAIAGYCLMTAGGIGCLYKLFV